jgi:hypothetical protein
MLHTLQNKEKQKILHQNSPSPGPKKLWNELSSKHHPQEYCTKCPIHSLTKYFRSTKRDDSHIKKMKLITDLRITFEPRMPNAKICPTTLPAKRISIPASKPVHTTEPLPGCPYESKSFTASFCQTPATSLVDLDPCHSSPRSRINGWDLIRLTTMCTV